MLRNYCGIGVIPSLNDQNLPGRRGPRRFQGVQGGGRWVRQRWVLLIGTWYKPLKSFDTLLDSTSKNRTLQQIPLGCALTRLGQDDYGLRSNRSRRTIAGLAS
jgi:hypothetical protein